MLLSSLSSAAQPAVLDYRAFQSPVKNQGGRNTCSGFAVAACLETFAGVPADLSEQHIYSGLKMLEYQSTDPVDRGGRINIYPQTLSKYGVLAESQMPYNPKQLDFSDTDHNLVQVIRESQGGPVSMLLNIEKTKVYVDPADCEVAEYDAGLDEANIKRLLRQGVRAIGIGYYLNEYWGNWDGKKNLLITPDSVGAFTDSSRNVSSFGSLRRMYGEEVFSFIDNVFSPEGNKAWEYFTNKQAQGHAVTIVGYNQQGFIIKNSWGSEWGDNGYATVSYDYHRLFAKRMLAIKKIRFRKVPVIGLSALTDLRLKVLPLGNRKGISVSLFCMNENGSPQLSIVTYKLYELFNGTRKLLDSRTVLAPITGPDNNPCFETVLLAGKPEPLATLLLGENNGLVLEAEVSGDGAARPLLFRYNGIKWAAGAYEK